jgi:transcriptional regulator with XRE-family HTH domain
MIIKTKIFQLSHGYYKNLSELAQAMGISVSQVYRVQEGKRRINEKFIIGALKAFPAYKFDDLFYLEATPLMPASNRAANEKKVMATTKQAREN